MPIRVDGASSWMALMRLSIQRAIQTLAKVAHCLLVRFALLVPELSFPAKLLLKHLDLEPQHSELRSNGF